MEYKLDLGPPKKEPFRIVGSLEEVEKIGKPPFVYKNN